jgi:hypothetical protein
MTTRPDIAYVLASQRASERASVELQRELAKALGGGAAADLEARKALDAYVAEQTERLKEENPELLMELEGAA